MRVGLGNGDVHHLPHQARKVKDAMDDAERRAIADAEASELAGEGAASTETSEGAAAE